MEIDVHTFKDAKEAVYLIDVRRQDEHDFCNIDKAPLYPLAELERHIETIRADAKGRQIVVYCHTGRRSLTAARILVAAGLPAVSLRGGIEAWSDIDPSVPRY